MKPEEDYPQFYLYRRVVKAKRFIDEYYHQKIDLDHIAGESCFSKFHFIRLFKKSYGRTPHQHLISIRIENAKKILEQGSSVSEACYQVGFDSLGSFSVLFKKICKQSPGEYQRQYIIRQQAIKRMPLNFIPNCFAIHKGWFKKSNFQEA